MSIKQKPNVVFNALNKVKLLHLRTIEKLTNMVIVKKVTKKLPSAIYSDCI